MSTLTPTQIEVLTAAADRPDGSIHPLPARLPSGAKNKVVASLLARGLVFDAKDSLEYRLTAEGYAAVGRECELPAPIEADPEIEAAVVATRPNGCQKRPSRIRRRSPSSASREPARTASRPP
jgi:hypothetical protein